MNISLQDKPFIVIDLWSGRYVKTEQGHESLNLTPNPVDGRYYGFCPPHNGIDIEKLGAKKSDNCVSGVLVIYVKKIVGGSNREIIAFCDNATIHRNPIDNPELQRWVTNNGERKSCNYCIESDYLYDLQSLSDKFRIVIEDNNPYMFRMQRFYKGKYKKLDESILAYLENYLNIYFNDDLSFQEQIQGYIPPYKTKLENTCQNAPQYVIGNDCKVVKKSVRISRQALNTADYKCAVDANHFTFNTNKGFPYMEGHHLIPCTASNAEKYWKEQNKSIDCEENIVCLCPTCHRKIHFGADSEKRKIIEDLYNIQMPKLKTADIKITVEELLKLYSV